MGQLDSERAGGAKVPQVAAPYRASVSTGVRGADMSWPSIVVAVAALAFGFLAGFTTFKRSLRWCRACGSVLRCPDCTPEIRLDLGRRSSAVRSGGTR